VSGPGEPDPGYVELVGCLEPLLKLGPWRFVASDDVTLIFFTISMTSL
jgi:hypothetical protein